MRRTGSTWASVVVTEPSIASEWPTMYLVQAWSETSAPNVSGWQKSGDAQVLSTISTVPLAWAASASAGKSCTSKVSEPGDSPTTTLVFSRIRSAMPAPIQGS